MESSQKAGQVFQRKLEMNNGLLIPQVGYGCYQVAKPEPFYWAVKYGYRHLDSAAYYKNEKEVGQEVKRAMADFGLKREDIFITSKITHKMQGSEKARECMEASLANFDLGYIDLMLIHWPGASKIKDDSVIRLRHETWQVLEEYLEKGKVKTIGVSNFQRKHFEKLMTIAKVKPAVNQIELHPMYVDQDTIDYCRENQILIQAYSPFAQWHSNLVTHPVVTSIAQKHSLDVARTLLLWSLQQNFVVLPKSETEARIANNILLEGLQLDEEDMTRMKELASLKMQIEWDPALVP